MLADTYGYEPFALLLRDDSNAVVGGLPFVATRGRWVALPFTDSLHPLLLTPATASDMSAAIIVEQRDAHVGTLEVRSPLASAAATVIDRGVLHTLELGEPDALFRAFESQVRRNIRKAQISEVSVRRGIEREDLTRVYYGLHAETRRRLGVPTQPRRFFDAIWRRMVEPGLASVLLAYKDGQAIAGAVFLEWNATTIYKFGASDRRHWHLRPNNLLFWECIQIACAAGHRRLDFGRTDLEDVGLRAFKRSWGAVEEPLRYSTFGEMRKAGAGSVGRALRPVLRVAPTCVGRGLGEVFYKLGA